MNHTQFDDLCTKLDKIMELVNRVPAPMREEVFKTLFDAAKECTSSHSYTDEILKLSDGAQPLKTYLEEKRPTSNIERSLLFVYYLEQCGLESITAKHIEACYELCNLNPPGNLAQNLRDGCGQRYAYLESTQNYFHTTPRGRAFCDNET